jgi:aminoglycoside phosphotransferase (APT) family kinase protein
MFEIHKTLPNFAPQPRGYGKCQDQDAHFFLCDYLRIDHELPDPVRLQEQLTEHDPWSGITFIKLDLRPFEGFGSEGGC